MLKELIPSKTLLTDINCGGCGNLIKDRIYLLTADRAWHTSCLRCTQCSQPLDNNLSCFSKDGNIYCKDDYLRLYSYHKCARCGTGLSSSDLVMRAKDLVFHVNCFSCILCARVLSVGDTAALRCGKLLCGEHYDVEILSEHNLVVGYEFLSGVDTKSRTRKRKTFISNSDESLDAITERSNTPLRLDLLQNDHTSSSSLDFHTYDGSQSPSSNTSSITGRGRSKRMRTSFKHHQLRTMKSYFSINQNPDAKDLKQLAQKTGLSKRVLQVWFQNARAKWRRNVMRQDSDKPTLSSTDPIDSDSGVNKSNSLANLDGSSEDVHHISFSSFYE